MFSEDKTNDDRVFEALTPDRINKKSNLKENVH